MKDYLEHKGYSGTVNYSAVDKKSIVMLATKEGIKLNDLVNRSLDYLIHNQEKVLKG